MKRLHGVFLNNMLMYKEIIFGFILRKKLLLTYVLKVITCEIQNNKKNLFFYDNFGLTLAIFVKRSTHLRCIKIHFLLFNTIFIFVKCIGPGFELNYLKEKSETPLRFLKVKNIFEIYILFWVNLVFRFFFPNTIFQVLRLIKTNGIKGLH